MRNVLVLMSTYNGETYIKEQLDSIYHAKDVTVDCFIRDDGSCDSTVSILQEYKERMGLQYYVGTNIRPAQSFRDLIVKCELGYDAYAYADQDDIWDEDKLKSATDALQSFSDTPCLWYCGVSMFGEREDKYVCSKERAEDLRAILMTFATINGCCMVFNEPLLKILKNAPMGLIDMHDSWTNYLCVASGGKIISDSKCYVHYRIHSANVLGKKDSIMKKIRRFMHSSRLRAKTVECIMSQDVASQYISIIAKYSNPYRLNNWINLLRERKPESISMSEFRKFKVQLLLKKY